MKLRRRSRPPSMQLTRRLFFRGMGLTWLVAFGSLRRQVLGLYGSRGIAPLAPRLARLKQDFGPRERLTSLPSLFWRDASDRTLVRACQAGQLLAVLLLLGIAPAISSLLLCGLYLSFVTVGAPFLNYQWDALLLEAGAHSVLVGGRRAPSWPAVFVMRWLAFRLHLESGIAKLQSGDPTWRDLSALSYHHWTQPLPTPLGWSANGLPARWHKAATAGTLVAELLVPPLALLPRPFRRAAAVVFFGIQGLIAASGNYGFFNLLSATLSVWLLDDDVIARGPAAQRRRAEREPRWHTALRAAALLPLFASSADELLGRLWPHPVPRALRPLLVWPRLARAVSSYGLFAVMTTSRPELVVEASRDGVTWTELQFRYKPGAPGTRPRWVAPHMPRLDWQLWFVALGQVGGWLATFLQRLLEGSPEVYALLAPTSFAHDPPKQVRIALYEYRMTSRDQRRRSGEWWSRERVGLFAGPLTRELSAPEVLA